MRLRLPQFPQVAGVFVGGCVERGEGSSFRRRAHAHNSKTDPYFGWICVRSWRRIGRGGFAEQVPPGAWNGTITKPSNLVLHEVAHILHPGQGHTDAWRNEVHRLGGKLNAWEKKGYWKARRHTWTKGKVYTVDSHGQVYRTDMNEKGEARFVYLAAPS